MSKVILISQVPLPYSKIGSWTTLYQNYLSSNHSIDCIVCEQPDVLFEYIKYGIVANTFSLKLQKIIPLLYIKSVLICFISFCLSSCSLTSVAHPYKFSQSIAF